MKKMSKVDKVLCGTLLLVMTWAVFQGVNLFARVSSESTIQTENVQLVSIWVIPPPITEPESLPPSIRHTWTSPLVAEYIPDECVEEVIFCYISYHAEAGCHLAIVWLFFEARDFTPQAIAGIIGNLQIESFDTINPLTVGDNGRSHGIAQWNGIRLANLRAFSTENGLYWRTLEAQLGFMYEELSIGRDVQWWRAIDAYVGDFYSLREVTCVVAATRALSQAYFRPGRPNMGYSGAVNRSRIQRAEQAFERFYRGGIS